PADGPGGRRPGDRRDERRLLGPRPSGRGASHPRVDRGTDRRPVGWVLIHGRAVCETRASRDAPRAGSSLRPVSPSPAAAPAWHTIPDAMRDAAGWTGGYTGAIAFETSLVGYAGRPSDWSNLLDVARRDKVALAGDPRVSDDASAAVYAAALGHGGSLDDARPGLEYFATLARHGTLLSQVATSASIDSGATPVAIRWSWDGFAHQ